MKQKNVYMRGFLTFCLCFSLIGQQEDVSYVAFGGISGSGRGQSSSQPVLGASELPGAQHWEQHDGKHTVHSDLI